MDQGSQESIHNEELDIGPSPGKNELLSRRSKGERKYNNEYTSKQN